MVSAIDATKPLDGILASKGDLRTNLAAAKAEIEALQGEAADIRNALGLALADALFPELGGDNTPTGAQQFATIILALDAAITAAAQSSGGPFALTDLTDIDSPDQQTRQSLQEPFGVTSQQADFSFVESTMAGGFIPIDPSSNDVQFLLPDPTSLTRTDGFLAALVCRSAANEASIAGPTDTLRYQNGIAGQPEVATELFMGLGPNSQFRSFVMIFLDGTGYQLVGPVRATFAEDTSINAPNSIPGNALAPLGLLDATFPSLLNLGGSKQAGGARNIERLVAGNTALAQTDAGTLVVHTGAGVATWDVPDLSDGTTIEVDNDGGDITFNPNGVKAVRGELTLSADASGAVRFTNGKIKFIGTVA